MIHDERKSLSSNLKVLLLIVAILFVIGLIFIYSASSVFALEKLGSAAFYVKKQLVGAFIGFILLIIVTKIPLDFIKRMAPFFFVGSLLLTMVTLIPSFSVQIHGSSRWLALGPLGFQPSELLKFASIIYIAYLIDKKFYRRASFFYSYLPLLLILGITSVVLLLQPDFGMTVAICATVFILFFIAEFKSKYLISTMLCAVPAAIYLIVLKPYRLKRIFTFLNPWADPQGSGFQVIQSLVAIGSGGFWGLGISNSKQKFFYLPMQHTDFIFSIIAEETGFIGVTLLISLYILFLYFGLRIAWRLQNQFAVYATLGFVILTTLQALINLCVATGIFPTKGIGLPFVSYGNSALICNFAMVGLLINFVKDSSN